MLPYFQTVGALLLGGKFLAAYVGAIRFLPGCSDVLLSILSIKTHSSMDIGLGYRCDLLHLTSVFLTMFLQI